MQSPSTTPAWVQDAYPCQKRRALSFVRRFWSKVDVRDPDECWPWLAARHASGYGCFRVAGKYEPAHRVAWQLHNGRLIPDGLWGLHRCDNPPCANPNHIFLGGPADNSADMTVKGRSCRQNKYAAKITRLQACAIRSLKGVDTQKSIAAQFGVSPSTVSLIWSERTWVDA